MSKFIKAIAVVTSLFAAGSAFADDCGDLLFYAQTANHKKEVQVCMFSYDHQNFINYRFGKIGQKPELDIVKPISAVTYFHAPSQIISGDSLYITNGDVQYDVGSGTNDEGVRHAEINVTKKGKFLASVKLDVNMTMNNIGYTNGHNLEEYGLRNDMDEDALSATTVLATPRN